MLPPGAREFGSPHSSCVIRGALEADTRCGPPGVLDRLRDVELLFPTTQRPQGARRGTQHCGAMTTGGAARGTSGRHCETGRRRQTRCAAGLCWGRVRNAGRRRVARHGTERRRMILADNNVKVSFFCALFAAHFHLSKLVNANTPVCDRCLSCRKSTRKPRTSGSVKRCGCG